MINVHKNFVNFCIKNQNFIRENFSIHGGSVIQYKKTGVIDILQPSVICGGFDFERAQNDCYILPTIRELIDYCNNFLGINNISIELKNKKYFVLTGKKARCFKGETEEEALLKFIIYFKK